MEAVVNPIPDVSIPNRSITSFVPVSEEMVSLSEAGFLVDSYWYNHGATGALKDCYVRKGLISRLRTAQKCLPKGFYLKIFDAYRPYVLQEYIWKGLQSRICASCGGNVSKATLDRWTSVFEELPTDDMKFAPSYMTGGAVGLTIVDAAGEDLDMGTDFYEFDSKTWSVYYERRKCNGTEKEIRNHLLCF